MNESHPEAPHIQTAKLGNAKTRNGSLDCIVVSMQTEDGDAGIRVRAWNVFQ